MSAPMTDVRERPILFSGEMVRAILDGRKSQTRRVMKPQPMLHVEALRDVPFENRWWPAVVVNDWLGTEYHRVDHEPPSWACPFGKAGDRLWVREALERGNWTDGIIERTDAAFYRADGDYALDAYQPATWVWQRDVLPSQFCPRGLSRITLEVIGVRAERVQDITYEDAVAEGVYEAFAEERDEAFSVEPPGESSFPTAQGYYSRLWDALNAKRGYRWDANPWVWVIEFRRVESA